MGVKNFLIHYTIAELTAQRVLYLLRYLKLDILNICIIAYIVVGNEKFGSNKCL